MPDSHPPFAVVFNRVEKRDLVFGPSVAFVFSVRNTTNQRLSFRPVGLVYVTAEKEKLRQSGFLPDFVTDEGETLDPGHVAKTAPFMWELKLPEICIDDQVTLTVASKEVPVMQLVTFICKNSQTARFEQSSVLLEAPELPPLTNSGFSAMMQSVLERYELLEDKAGIALRGLAAEGDVSDKYYNVTIRGEVIYNRSGDLGGTAFRLQAIAYKADGGVMKIAYTDDFSQSPSDPFDVFELSMYHLLEKPARITVYPIPK